MQVTHEDERRSLTSFPEAKMIEAKKDCVIGQHYHKKKTEVFILSSGECRLGLTPPEDQDHYLIGMLIGARYEVMPGQYHEFHLKEGSVLIGLNSRVYDSTDDYRLEE